MQSWLQYICKNNSKNFLKKYLIISIYYDKYENNNYYLLANLGKMPQCGWGYSQITWYLPDKDTSKKPRQKNSWQGFLIR